MLHEENIYRDLLRLAAVPSVSGTEREVLAADELRDMLREIPYFQAHPENLRLTPLEDDLLGRYLVAAFLPGEPGDGDTVILTGHYDVVDTEEYGPLRDLAFDPTAVTARMGELALDEDSRRDWESGRWLFGRGTADMKFGHALCLELLRHYLETPGALRGNLLYLAVCGEETNSEGMLRAVPFLNALAAEKGLRYKALLLTECYMTEDQAHDPVRYVHYGASGKVMPLFFCAGEATHAGEPFMGLDPNLLNAALCRRLSLNPDFCQRSGNEITPPPVCLKCRDLKEGYSVSTPLAAVSYYNFISVRLEPEALTEKLLGVCREAFREVLADREAKIEAYRRTVGPVPAARRYEPCVRTFGEIYEAVAAEYDGDYGAHLDELARSLAARKMELQELCIELVRHTVSRYRDKRPMIVLAFIPPFYPDIFPDRTAPAAAELLAGVEDVIAYARETYGQTLKLKEYYMGLSDLSYTGLNPALDYDGLLRNLVGAGSAYRFPLEELKRFSVPAVVLGGWGKDFHKHTERLERTYNFQVLPALYDRLLRRLLG